MPYEPGTPFLQIANQLLEIDRDNQGMAMKERELQQRLNEVRMRADEQGYQVDEKTGAMTKLPQEVMVQRQQQQGAQRRAAALAELGLEPTEFPGGMTPEQILGQKVGLPGGLGGAVPPLPHGFQPPKPRKGFRSVETGEEMVPSGGGFVTPQQAELMRRKQQADIQKAERQAEAEDLVPFIDAEGNVVSTPNPFTGQPQPVMIPRKSLPSVLGRQETASAARRKRDESVEEKVGDFEAEAAGIQAKMQDLQAQLAAMDPMIRPYQGKDQLKDIAKLRGDLVELQGKIQARQGRQKGGPAPAAQAPKAEHPPGTKVQRNKKTGEIRYVHPDGTVMIGR